MTQQITVIHRIDHVDKSYTGYQIAPDIVMELDAEGPVFSRYNAITGDTVRVEDAISEYSITFHGDKDGQLLAAMGAAAADMTLRELAQLLLDAKGRVNYVDG